ncbi:DinB family protein [Frondihabitans cladoniiphilus]|uniref:DinB family protein n=1 Tax=Frondihabitans cladoniiphilus TaxID=715785 RepID=A0ABP8W591_9MICO
MPIIPETKSWTWILDERCPECGFDSTTVTFREIPTLLRENALAWPEVLDRADVRLRPDDSTWSPLEYGAHVRDVFRVNTGRFELMLAEDDPTFANWDQDATAVDDDYASQEPLEVVADLLEAAEAVADLLDGVEDSQLGRRGLRSDGSHFTVETLARYFVHDPIHHLHDVRG